MAYTNLDSTDISDLMTSQSHMNAWIHIWSDSYLMLSNNIHTTFLLFFSLTNSVWVTGKGSDSEFWMHSISNRWFISICFSSKNVYYVILFVLWYIYALYSKKKGSHMLSRRTQTMKKVFFGVIWQIWLFMCASNLSWLLCIEIIAI